MNDVAMPVADAVASSTDLTLLTENPVAILTSAEKFDAFYEKVKAEVESHVPDLTTDKGRKAIASLAFKVVKTKTALDDAGKKLTEDKRREIAVVDAARKTIRDKLDALRDEVRKPLTEWEAAEEARVARCQEVLGRLKTAGAILLSDDSAGVAGRLAEVEAIQIDEAHFGDLFEFAVDAKAAAVLALSAGRDRLAQEEADRAELARLRQAEEDRQVREAVELAERERLAAEAEAANRRAEAERQAAEAAERERVAEEARAAEAAAVAKRQAEEAAAQAAAQAEARARDEAAAQAREEREAAERAHQQQLEEERRQREAAEAEARRLAAEQEAKRVEAAAQQAAAEARAKDIEHRGAVMRASKEALMEHAELDEATAKRVVLVIAAKSVPNVTITF